MAESFVSAVHDAATRRKESVAALVEQMQVATTPAEVERIEANMMRVKYDYEATLMAATVAVQARNDQARAELAALEQPYRLL